MNTEGNKDLIRSWLRMGEGGFRGDFTEFFAPDYQGHLGGQEPQTLDELMGLARAFAAAFSNIKYGVEDLLAIDDKVILRVRTRATHTGEFHGTPPTNRQIAMTGIVIYRIVAGRIVESWGELDLLGLFRQLRSP